jgi:hypothetical protein
MMNEPKKKEYEYTWGVTGQLPIPFASEFDSEMDWANGNHEDDE